MLKPYLLYLANKTSPNNIAIQTSNQKITYKQLYHIVCSLACFLEKDPYIQNSYYIGLAPKKNLEYIIFLYAIQLLEKVAVLINPNTPISTYKSYLDCIITESFLHDKIDQIPFQKIKSFISNKLTNKYLGKNIPTMFSSKKYRYILADKKNNIIFSSGTTQTPKAIVHSYKNHYYSAIASNKHLNFTSQDSWFLNLPLFHVSGYSILHRVALAKASIVLDESIKTSISSFISMVPTQIIQTLQNKEGIHYLKKKKCILLGGSSISKKIIHKIIKYQLSVYCTYGSSEMSSQIATADPKTLFLTQSVQAKILPLCLVRINNNNEIHVKSPTLFEGYLSNNKILISKKLDISGYWNTQDLGSIHSNLLSITGRADNMFISAGENIYPEEIEYYIEQHPDIVKSCVLFYKSSLYGKRPIAYIETLNILSKKKIEEIKVFLLEKLPNFKIPDYFYTLPSDFQDNKNISRKELLKYYEKSTKLQNK